ncbi:MAG: replicative DNA helicase [Spirochaetales bacterium]|jgi:replicative DNA helicase|nr:replicative DNA helicase [Spirochaetales bacterium]
MPSGELKDKYPPHHDDAEAATLGAILLDAQAVDQVIEYLRPDDFYRPANGRIFQAMMDLSLAGQPIDLLTLSDKLRGQGLLDACGGAGYLSSLTSTVPTSANVEYYAQVVRQHSFRRALIRTAGEITARCYEDSEEIAATLEYAEKSIFDITDSQRTAGYRRAGDILNQTISVIEKHYYDKNEFTGLPSGYTDLDEITNGFQKSNLIIIGARPSVGKTALALSMAANMAIRGERPVGFFSLEMSEDELMFRLLSGETRISSEKLRRGLLTHSDFGAIVEVAGKIYEKPLFFCDTPSITLLELRAQARRLKSKENIQAIFIDYIGLIHGDSRSSASRWEVVGEFSRSLKALARELEIPVICLCQLGRQAADKEYPSLADLRDSGSIEQDADVVLFLHRDLTDSEKPAKLIVAKQRNGPLGQVELAYLNVLTRFESLSRKK